MASDVKEYTEDNVNLIEISGLNFVNCTKNYFFFCVEGKFGRTKSLFLSHLANMAEVGYTHGWSSV